MSEFTIKNRFSHDEAGEMLEMYKADMKIPKVANNQIQLIIDKITSLENLATLDNPTLAEYNIILQSYAYFLQEEENKAWRYMRWADNNLDYILSTEYNNIESNYLDAKMIAILAHNPTASEIHKNKLVAELKYNTLKNLSVKIAGISKSIETLIYAKKTFKY